MGARPSLRQLWWWSERDGGTEGVKKAKNYGRIRTEYVRIGGYGDQFNLKGKCWDETGKEQQETIDRIDCIKKLLETIK